VFHDDLQVFAAFQREGDDFRGVGHIGTDGVFFLKAEVQEDFGAYRVQRAGVEVGVLYLADVFRQVLTLFPAVFPVEFARIGRLGGMVSGGVSGQFRGITGYEGGGDAQQGRVGNRPGAEGGRKGKKFRLWSGKCVITHGLLLMRKKHSLRRKQGKGPDAPLSIPKKQYFFLAEALFFFIFVDRLHELFYTDKTLLKMDRNEPWMLNRWYCR
jgi:hypothetical protein